MAIKIIKVICYVFYKKSYNTNQLSLKEIKNKATNLKSQRWYL